MICRYAPVGDCDLREFLPSFSLNSVTNIVRRAISIRCSSTSVTGAWVPCGIAKRNSGIPAQNRGIPRGQFPALKVEVGH